MSPQDLYFLFTIDDQHYAMALSHMGSVIRAVELIRCAHPSDILLGLLNLKGEIIPVVNIRHQFHLKDSDMTLDDRIIISHSLRGTLAFIVDEIRGIAELTLKILPSAIDPFIKGTGRYNHETILIIDVDELLPCTWQKKGEVRNAL
ncbi:MAG: chemotaxis protein CheW [bacterium]